MNEDPEHYRTMFRGPEVYSEDLKHKNPHDTIAIYWAQLCFGKINRKYKSKTLFISKDYLIKKVKRQIFCICIRD